MATFKSSGTDKDVKVQPTGTGKVVVGTGAAAATVASDGDNDLVLQTGNATTGSITVTDGANGNISLTPNGTGAVVIPKADITGGTIDGTVIGGTTPAAVTTSSLVATTADITGGTIDGTVIGGTAPAAGSFTQVNAGGGAEATPSITNTGDTNTGIYFPAADTVGVSTNGSERMRIDSSGNVELKTTTANLILPSGGGIDFSATGNPTRGVLGGSVLDDYEYGSSGSSSGSNADAFFAGSTSISYSSSFSEYVVSYIKIGDLVTVFFSLDNYNVSGNVDLGSGVIGFYLPYTVATASAKTINYRYTGFLQYYDGTNYGKGFVYCTNGGSGAFLRKDSIIDYFNANGTTRTFFEGSITYRSA